MQPRCVSSAWHDSCSYPRRVPNSDGRVWTLSGIRDRQELCAYLGQVVRKSLNEASWADGRPTRRGRLQARSVFELGKLHYRVLARIFLWSGDKGAFKPSAVKSIRFELPPERQTPRETSRSEAWPSESRIDKVTSVSKGTGRENRN